MFIEKYLTEQTLISILLKRIDKEGICNKAFKPHKFRPDFCSNKHKLVVEFDGYQHYTSSKTIVNDFHKDKILSATGYEVIRIPYFVQFTQEISNFLFPAFKFEKEDFNDYSHGFISDNCILPADFCSLGIEKFKQDLMKFHFIKDEILMSLVKKTEKLKDSRLVYFQ